VKVGNVPLTEWQAAFSALNPQVTINTVMRYLDAAELEGGDSPLPFDKSKSKMLLRHFQMLQMQLLLLILSS